MSYWPSSLIRSYRGAMLCLGLQKWFEFALSHSCFWMLSPPSQNSILLKQRAGFRKLTRDLQSFVFFVVFGRLGKGESLRVSYLSLGYSLFPISPLPQSSYWMSWPSSKTHLLCCWMDKFFRTLLLRISNSPGKERYIWLFKLNN